MFSGSGVSLAVTALTSCKSSELCTGLAVCLMVYPCGSGGAHLWYNHLGAASLISSAPPVLASSKTISLPALSLLMSPITYSEL